MGNKENVIFWTMQIDDTILILLLKLLSQQLSDVFNFQSFCSSWCLCVTGRKWGSQDMWSLLWGFSWPGSFHKYDFDPKMTNFHSVSWVEELWPPVLLELLATVCENWSPRRQGQPEVSAGTSKHQTQGSWMIQHTLVSVHWRHASQWHLSAVRWRPGPVAALRVADDEASACTGSRHQMVPGSQLHLCCCRRGMRLLPQNQLREGGMPGELLLPLQGGVAPQSDLRPGTSPAPAIASQLCLLLARLWSSGGWFWTEGVPQMFSPHREDGRWQLQPHDLCRYFIIQTNFIWNDFFLKQFSCKDYIHKPGNVNHSFVQCVGRSSVGCAWRRYQTCIISPLQVWSQSWEVETLKFIEFCSGCTFWGKKPWSRKKKLLWQLGTLVGAPVGIALIGENTNIPHMYH